MFVDFDWGGDDFLSDDNYWDSGSIDDNYWGGTGSGAEINTPDGGMNYDFSDPSGNFSDVLSNMFSGQGVQGQQGGMSGMIAQQSMPVAQLPGSTNEGGISSFLSNLFADPKKNNMMAMGASALASGLQNKQKANALNAASKNPAYDPFGSQRPFYQQQLQQATINPYSSPIVTQQVQQLQRAQAIKDAAAGRRSNSVGSAPAVLAAQAQIAQNYLNSLMQPAGANIQPNGGAISNLQNSAINADSNGYLTPIMTALGNYTKDASNTATLEKLFGGG